MTEVTFFTVSGSVAPFHEFLDLPLDGIPPHIIVNLPVIIFSSVWRERLPTEQLILMESLIETTSFLKVDVVMETPLSTLLCMET